MILFGRRIPAVFSLLIWCALWEVVGRSGLVFIFPPFSGVLVALVKLVQQSDFHAAAIISLKAFAYGITIAIVGGIAGGGSGLAKGVAVGVGTGAVVNLSTRGDEVEFPAEQLFVFRLAVQAQFAVR